MLLNKLRLIRLEDREKQIRIITRSPEQYEDIDFSIEVEENVGGLEEYRCCVVFDDMLDSNQRLIDPFLLDISCVVFIIYVRVLLMHQKSQFESIRI